MPRTSDGAAKTNEVVVWLRRDLRLHDNPSLNDALRQPGAAVRVLVVFDPELLRRAGPSRRAAFEERANDVLGAAEASGLRASLAHGDPIAVLDELCESDVYVNADVSPLSVRRDRLVRARLESSGRRMHTHWGTLVQPPGTVLTARGTLSAVFTHFYKRWCSVPWWPWPVAPEGTRLEPGRLERTSAELLGVALERADQYSELRDRPDLAATTALSTALRFGTISPRLVAACFGETSPVTRQLAWRDFYAHQLFENQHMATSALRPAYDTVVWRTDGDGFDRWCRGLTGYPLVDAGMRELNRTGFMHNRVRMVTASFLVKDLLIDWRRGERYFARQLVDFDPAQNAGNWQWVAGTGLDAAPYFRVMNPVAQSRKFDPNGAYIRRWVPELAEFSATEIHEPWSVGPERLDALGVSLGKTYPRPIVDHAHARARTLAAYREAVASDRG